MWQRSKKSKTGEKNKFLFLFWQAKEGKTTDFSKLRHSYIHHTCNFFRSNAQLTYEKLLYISYGFLFFGGRYVVFFWSLSYSYIFFVELDRVPLFCRVCAREKMSRPVSFISSKPMTSSTFYSPSTFLACLYLTYIIFYFFLSCISHTCIHTHTHRYTYTRWHLSCFVVASFFSNFYVSSGGNFFIMYFVRSEMGEKSL